MLASLAVGFFCRKDDRFIEPTKGFEPANPQFCPTEDKEKATANRGIFFRVNLPDKLEFDIHFLGTDCFMYSI